MESKSDDEDKGQDYDEGAGGEEGGTKRRRRGDAGERNYTCGCGKSYLSYPALYTHIKTKHGGVTPQGTSQPQTNGKSGRGRPKKEDSANKVKEEDGKENFETPDSQSANDTVINYLRTLGEKDMGENQAEDANPVVSEEVDGFDLIGKFPHDVFSRPEEYQIVLKELDILCQNKNIGLEEIDSGTGLKRTCMNKIFAIFIYYIGRNLTESFYREFVFFLMMYRRALNEIGWPIKAEVSKTSISESEKRLEFCAINNGEYTPDICNDFITDKWGEYLSQYKLTGFKFLGNDTELTKNAVFLTQHFCNWLNAQRYTNSRLQINDDNDI